MQPAVPATADVWSRVVSRLSHDPSEHLNTFHESCGRWASDPHRLALVVRHADGRRETWTYAELAAAAASASAMFASLGLRRGDRVGSVLSRQVEAWIVALAAWRSGIVVVPLFVGFGSEALQMRLTTADVRAVVVDHRWRQAVDDALSNVEHDCAVVTVSRGDGSGAKPDDWVFWDRLGNAGSAPDVAVTSADEPATVMFTSGTTSEPKACVLPHSGFLSLVPFVEHVFAVGQDDLLFSTSDPGWSYGLYTSGCVVMSLGIPRVIYTGDFDPEAWLDVIEVEQATFAAGAPTAFRRMLASARSGGFPASLRGASTAGEPLDPETVTAWRQTSGTEIRDGYGLTEVGMVLGNLGNPPLAVEAGSMSGAVPGFEVDLLDADGRAVEAAGQGVLAIRRPRFQLSSGYENMSSAWDARWQDDRFVTDDLFTRDDGGRFTFTGRVDDVIVTAGYNVGPAEVEAVLLQHPAVLEAAVVAAPDPDRGSVVRAVLVTSTPATAELTRELQDRVRHRIGRHAYPRKVEYVDALPRTATGKIMRAALRTAATAAD